MKKDRKHKAELDDSPSGPRKPSRSTSSSPASSVSTISTNMSYSPPPKQAAGRRASSKRETFQSTGGVDVSRSRKRRMSSRSDSPFNRDPPKASGVRKSIPQIGQSVRSPYGRGRGEDSDSGSVSPAIGSSRKRRRSRSSSMSYTSESMASGRRRYRSANDARRTRARRSSVSPDIRGRRRSSRVPRSSRRTRSRSNSMDKSQVARERRSLTRERAQRPYRIASPPIRSRAEKRQDRRSEDSDRYGSSFRDEEHEDRRPPRPVPASLPRKERSLSPFSKRLALTQAMNMRS